MKHPRHVRAARAAVRAYREELRVDDRGEGAHAFFLALAVFGYGPLVRFGAPLEKEKADAT